MEVPLFRNQSHSLLEFDRDEVPSKQEVHQIQLALHIPDDVLPDTFQVMWNMQHVLIDVRNDRPLMYLQRIDRPVLNLQMRLAGRRRSHRQYWLP